MRRGFLSHHSRGDDENLSAAELHFVELPLLEHDQVQGLGQDQIGVLPMRAMRLKVINFGEDLAQTTHVKWLRGNAPALHQEAELRENFLRSTESEHRNQDRTFPGEHPLD